jgi:hypothetical protein
MNKADAPLTPADRVRLVKLLGMIGSSHDNEALNAARLADRLVRDRGARWSDVLDAPVLDGAVLLQDFLTNWKAIAHACVLNGAGVLSDWELNFCRSLADFARPTAKQLAVLRRLVVKLDAEGVLR